MHARVIVNSGKVYVWCRVDGDCNQWVLGSDVKEGQVILFGGDNET